MKALTDKFITAPPSALRKILSGVEVWRDDHAPGTIRMACPMGIQDIPVPAKLRLVSEARIALNGLRCVKLAHNQAEMFDRTDPTVNWKDYRQPYNEMVVALPTSFAKTRAAKAVYPSWAEHLETIDYFGGLDDQGQSIFGPRLKVDVHYPTEVTLCHDPQLRLLYVGVYFSSGQAFHLNMWDRDRHHTLAEGIAATTADGEGFDSVFITTDEEYQSIRAAIRVAVNACLFLTNYGGREDYENPARAKRLWARLARLRKAKSAKKQAQRRKAKEELNNMAKVMTISQKIKLARHELGNKTAGHPTGRTNVPHWRRGHWRQQARGRGWSERRQIYISPVLVNAHLFGGDGSDTNVTYDLEHQT